MRFNLKDLSDEDAEFFVEHGFLRQTPEVDARIKDTARRMDHELAPYQAFIDQRSAAERDLFDKLFSRDHDAIGRVLKQHLILENYITHHLESTSPNHEWRAAGLRFAQKVGLLPTDNAQVQWIIPGIREINRVRNSLGHEIDAEPSLAALRECLQVLGLTYPYWQKTYSNAIDVIEDFTELACRWLSVDNEVEQIFRDARARVEEERLRESETPAN